MLTKTVLPKTKQELIRALQSASFKRVEVYEGERLRSLPGIDRLQRGNSVVIVLGA